MGFMNHWIILSSLLLIDYLKTSIVPCHVTKASDTTAVSIAGTHCNTATTLPQVLFRLTCAYTIAWADIHMSLLLTLALKFVFCWELQLWRIFLLICRILLWNKTAVDTQSFDTKPGGGDLKLDWLHCVARHIYSDKVYHALNICVQCSSVCNEDWCIDTVVLTVENSSPITTDTIKKEREGPPVNFLSFPPKKNRIWLWLLESTWLREWA